MFICNILAKFHGNILNLSKNIAKSFRGRATFLTHTVYAQQTRNIARKSRIFLISRV